MNVLEKASEKPIDDVCGLWEKLLDHFSENNWRLNETYCKKLFQSFADSQLSKERERAEGLVKALRDLVDGKKKGVFSVDVEMTIAENDDYEDDFADAVIYASSLWTDAEEALAKNQEEGK